MLSGGSSALLGFNFAINKIKSLLKSWAVASLGSLPFPRRVPIVPFNEPVTKCLPHSRRHFVA